MYYTPDKSVKAEERGCTKEQCVLRNTIIISHSPEIVLRTCHVTSILLIPERSPFVGPSFPFRESARNKRCYATISSANFNVVRKASLERREERSDDIRYEIWRKKGEGPALTIQQGLGLQGRHLLLKALRYSTYSHYQGLTRSA